MRLDYFFAVTDSTTGEILAGQDATPHPRADGEPRRHPNSLLTVLLGRRSKGLPEFFFPFDDQPSFERYLASIWDVLPLQMLDLTSLSRVDRGPKGPLLPEVQLSTTPLQGTT